MRTVLSAALLMGLILGAAQARGQLVSTPLEYQRVGSQVVLSWTNTAFSLQVAPSVDAVFTNLPGATSPHTNALSGAQAYFRLLGVEAPAGMAFIPAGSFTMGNCKAPSEGQSDELPLHTVYVSAFYMGRHEVTKALWDEVKAWSVGNGYSYSYTTSGSGKATNHPVQSLTWYDAVKWCNARSQKESLTPCYYTDGYQTNVYRSGQILLTNACVKWDANGYRLPTEAEWEKAARGGASGRRFPWTDTDNISHSYANYNAGDSYPYNLSYPTTYHPTFATGGYPYTSPVGSFTANGYGLYDMAGNVWEWCWDWYGAYSSDSQTDPHGPASGSLRVERGGSWYYGAVTCRAALRNRGEPTGLGTSLGFRCVRGL